MGYRCSCTLKLSPEIHITDTQPQCRWLLLLHCLALVSILMKKGRLRGIYDLCARVGNPHKSPAEDWSWASKSCRYSHS